VSSFRVGDTVFNRKGVPGVVTHRDPKTAELEVEIKGEKFEQARRIGFINGLSEEQRASYNSVIEDIRENNPEPIKRVDALQEKISELKKDPKNFVLTKYLSAEQAHIMNSEHIQPKSYQIEEHFLR
jgi:hypothetical protein